MQMEEKTLKRTIRYSVLGAVALVLACSFVGNYNYAVNCEENVQGAFSNVNITLTNRYNKLNELLQYVKQYDEHEYKTLKDTIEARGKGMSHNEAENCMMQIAAVAEQYPQLQSQKNYKTLMDEASLIENKVAQVKTAYNNTVREYNVACRSFPANIILSLTGYEKRSFEYYEIYESVKDVK